MYTIESTGILASLGTVNTWSSPTAVTVEPSGHFVYVANENADVLSMYKIEATGVLTPFGKVDTGRSPTAVAVDPSGHFVYAVNYGPPGVSTLGSVSVYTVDPTTGQLTALGSPVPTMGRGRAIAIVDFAPPSTLAPGVFHEGSWYLDVNSNGTWDGCGPDLCLAFGLPGDIPVVGDWNGSGMAKIGVFRNGEWYLDLNSNGAWDGCTVDRCMGFGLPGDRPIVLTW
jgi:hypothetical protein